MTTKKPQPAPSTPKPEPPPAPPPKRSFHHVELKSKGGSPIGRTTSLTIDGVRIRRFRSVRIDCSYDDVDHVTIEMFATVDISTEGVVVVKAKDPDDNP